MDLTRFLHNLTNSRPNVETKPLRLFGELERATWEQRFGAGALTKGDVKEPMTREDVKQARLRDHVTVKQNPMSGPKMKPKKGMFRL